MTTYATGNPLGSKDPRDLYDNAENFDAAMNDRVNTTWNDRFGVTRPTLKGYEEQFNYFLAGSGFENPPLIYVDGSPLTVDRATQIIDRGGNLYSVKLPSSFPVVLSGNWSEDEGLLVVRGDQSLRQEITSTSPSEGSSIIGNSTVSVSSVADIKNQTKRADLKLSLSSYHPLGKSGGGTFIWSPSTPKSNHDGGTIFSPTVPWDGSQSTLSDYLDGEGETDPSGSGCWLRIFDEVKLEYFGGLISETIDSSASFLAVIKYCLSNNKELNLPDGVVRLNSPAVINGSTTLFSSVKIRGTFKTSGVSAGYVVSRVGSLIYTDGNSALDISFNDFRNENFDIRGVAFVDTSFYPPGTPASSNPAIIIRKGNPDGSSNRYITGNVLEDVAFVSYQDPIKTIGVAAGLPAYNYVGPTSFNRVYFYRCGTVMHLQDCTYNHLFMNECLLFDISSQAIFLTKTDSGTGGNVVVTFNNCVFESIWGIMNTANGLTSSSMRNTAVFNSCNREFCGLYGPTGGGGNFAGSPLGYIGHTDIMINGNWERGQAFGETTLPAIDPGAVIFASRYVDVLMNGGQVGSPEYVNVVDVSGTIPASGSLTKTFNVSGSFVLNADVAYDDGFGGHQNVVAYGNPTGSKARDVTGTIISAGLSATYGDGPSGAAFTVTFNNGTASPINVNIRVTNKAGLIVTVS
ncbi:structural protein [Pseudomonas aeruginosa]|uniref:structural protein n=1 Tax=Pseudomonas aeruginosa TaxID=287 RepID=UPI000F61BB2B|nr:structural protein [Pseudomonas aeruginosa]RRI69851.1 structural protein [Pseudomonas aeruginosa]RRI89016.1 structural protein [Pseudomonas aeruginosa]RRJ04185.1 structural protein [Pseudomonas aeruginosa]